MYFSPRLNFVSYSDFVKFSYFSRGEHIRLQNSMGPVPFEVSIDHECTRVTHSKYCRQMSRPHYFSWNFQCQFICQSCTSFVYAEHIHLLNFPKLVPIERTFEYEANDVFLFEQCPRISRSVNLVHKIAKLRHYHIFVYYECVVILSHCGIL